MHHARQCAGSLHCADARDASVTEDRLLLLLLLLLRCQSAFLVLLERKSGLDIRPSRVAKFKVRKAISAAIRDLTVADVSHIIKKSSKACAAQPRATSGLLLVVADASFCQIVHMRRWQKWRPTTWLMATASPAASGRQASAML